MNPKDFVQADLPEGIQLGKYLEEANAAKAMGHPLPDYKLDDLFVGTQHDSLRTAIKKEGFAQFPGHSGGTYTVAVGTDPDGNVMSVAASVPRQPGRAQDFLTQVSDFTEGGNSRKDQLALFWRIYKAEGLVNNAINKSAPLVATKGSFKVRRVKGKRGKGGDKRADEFRQLLQYWLENVNSVGDQAVITGDQGIQAFISQGVRKALVEGDHFARTQWSKVKVGVLGGTAYSLPMVLQTFAGDQVEIPQELIGSNIELIYWKPPKSFVETVTKPKDKNLKPYLDKLIPSDVLAALKKDGQYLLDPSLMIHVKHRGMQTTGYGESFVECAMTDIAFKRALQALDIVTIENLINRLVILKVGSDNKDSVYHKAAVTAERVTTLQNMLRRIGPSSMVIWAGPDLEALEVGAHNALLDTEPLYRLANSMIRSSLGVPAALLTGEGEDGKAAGWAAQSGLAAQLSELQNQYVKVMTTIARRIAEENGFEDVDVIFEFSQSLLANKAEMIAAFIQAYAAGAIPIEVLIRDGFGLDFDAVFNMMQWEVDEGIRDYLFGLPKGAQTTNAGGLAGGGGGDGRPPKKDSGKSDPRENTEVNNPDKTK
jgi:hypothetical protein